MEEKNLNFNTLQVHAGYTPDAVTKSRAVPIYQTTSYVFDSTEHAANLFELNEFGNIYTRIMNPTTDVLEKRVAALDGGLGALAFSSGSAAITCAILNIANSGDEIVSASTLYGGTYNLFDNTLPKLGINVRFVDPENSENFEKAINNKTKAIYIESIGNPGINIIDIENVAKIAHDNNIPLIVDNTFATPYLLKPIEFGADVVVYSATKFLGGHGNSIAGIIVDSGNFNWNNGKYPGLSEEDKSYHGIRFTEKFGNIAYIIKARVQLLRDIGACLSPFNSFLILQGIETLSLRIEKHIENTKKIVDYLDNHKKVKWVNYPSMKGNKYKELADKYLPKGAGSIFTFGIQGGIEAGKEFIKNLEIFSHLANVADVRSLVIHPASTTHNQLSREDKIKAGVTDDMIRLSIGIEDVNDLIDDISQALDKL